MRLYRSVRLVRIKGGEAMLTHWQKVFELALSLWKRMNKLIHKRFKDPT